MLSTSKLILVQSRYSLSVSCFTKLIGLVLASASVDLMLMHLLSISSPRPMFHYPKEMYTNVKSWCKISLSEI